MLVLVCWTTGQYKGLLNDEQYMGLVDDKMAYDSMSKKAVIMAFT